MRMAICFGASFGATFRAPRSQLYAQITRFITSGACSILMTLLDSVQ